MSEGNYQEAIILFTAAIEIDPKQADAYVKRGDAHMLSSEAEENLDAAKADYEKALALDETNVEAYLGLADVYIRRGDYEGAIHVLQRGIERTGNNQKISDKLDNIKTIHNNATAQTEEYSFLFTDNIVKLQDWIVNGKPVDECELVDFQADFPDKSEGAFSVMHEDGWHYSPRINSSGDSCNVDVDKHDSEWGDTTLYIRLEGEAQQCDFYFQPNLRGIKTSDTYSEVLQKIGFSEEGIQYLAAAGETFFCDMPDAKTQFAFEYSNYSDRELCIRSIEFHNSDRNIPQSGFTELRFTFYNERLYEIFFRFEQIM